MKLSPFLLSVLMSVTLISSLMGKAPRPNIVLVLADDLGWSDIGCYGGEIPTPNIDALANSGLRFTQFYNNAVCGPTRASLLTGLYCQQIGHRGDHWNQPTDFRKCVTLGEVLQSAGYHTMMVGKWQERQLPARHGFDRFFGPMCQGKISYFHEVQMNPYFLDEERWQVPKEGFYMTDALTDYSVKFIEDATARRVDEKGKNLKPFFLYTAYVAPHWPLHAREADIAPHRARYLQPGWEYWRKKRLENQRAAGLVPGDWKLSAGSENSADGEREEHRQWQAERMAVYAAQVASIDSGVGRIMDAVRKAGVADNTLFVFLSDNGAAPDGGLIPTESGFGFSAKQKNDTWRLDGVPIRSGSGPQLMPGSADTFAAYGLAWATVSNTPFRSTKMTAYEGGVRTPLVINWPAGLRRKGETSDHVGHVIDFMATFADLAGANYPQEFQGRKPLLLEGKSLAPIFRGEAGSDHDVLAWRAPLNQALRAGDWKLVNTRVGTPWQLYDLKNDGGETQDLATKFPDKVKELAAKWQQWAERCAATP